MLKWPISFHLYSCTWLCNSCTNEWIWYCGSLCQSLVVLVSNDVNPVSFVRDLHMNIQWRWSLCTSILCCLLLYDSCPMCQKCSLCLYTIVDDIECPGLWDVFTPQSISLWIILSTSKRLLSPSMMAITSQTM